MGRTDISIKITSIENDLELLKNGHIHELEKVPGTPKCSTFFIVFSSIISFETFVNFIYTYIITLFTLKSIYISMKLYFSFI